MLGWVAIGVVLYHRAARCQLGGVPRILIRQPRAAHLLEEEGPSLGHAGGADRTPELRQKYDKQEDQACQHGPGHAISPDSPVSKTGIQPVGVRRGPTPDIARALRHNAQRRLEGVVQGQRSSSSHPRGPRTQRQAPRQFGKHPTFCKMCLSLAYLWEELKLPYRSNRITW